MYKIRIIIPYFGRLPELFKFWYQSALDNPNVDFLFFSDWHIEQSENIKVVSMGFDEFRKIIQNHYDFSINLPSPYKLCDFRGAYGDIFNEYLKDYDFWGFGDIDMVYGQIRDFITDEVLDKYDVISGWGHLTLYRNNEYCNTFYKTKKEGFLYYKDVFQQAKNIFFDEYLHKGLSDLWMELHPDKIWNSFLFDDISIPSINFNFVSVFHPEYSENLIFEYVNKNLYRIYTKGNEIIQEPTLYAHFQKRSFLRVKTENTNNFLIIPNKIISVKEISLSRLKRWGRKRELQRYFFIKKNGWGKKLKSLFSKLRQ